MSARVEPTQSCKFTKMSLPCGDLGTQFPSISWPHHLSGHLSPWAGKIKDNMGDLYRPDLKGTPIIPTAFHWFLSYVCTKQGVTGKCSLPLYPGKKSNRCGKRLISTHSGKYWCTKEFGACKNGAKLNTYWIKGKLCW